MSACFLEEKSLTQTPRVTVGDETINSNLVALSQHLQPKLEAPTIPSVGYAPPLSGLSDVLERRLS
jgi:hypothetical protein